MADQEMADRAEPASIVEGDCGHCGPQEIWIWRKDGTRAQKKQQVSAALLEEFIANANKIRDCTLCRAKFSRRFDMPDIWWRDYNRKGNGYTGAQNILDKDGKVVGYVTWTLFKTKHVDPEHGYKWTKVNIFTHWLKSGRRVVLSFEQDKGERKTQESIVSTLLGSLTERQLDDPFWAYHKLMDLVVSINDEAVWSITKMVREIEKNGTHSIEKPNYRSLNDLARHTIHITEVLSVTCETAQRIMAQHRSWMDGNCGGGDENGAEGLALSRNAQERLSFYAQVLSSFRHRMLSTKDRLTNEINLSFNTIAQIDSATTVKDSATMKKIAWLTAAFLPATFTSAIFSTTFFNFSPEANRWTMSDKFWVLWVVALPLTIAMPIIWKLYPAESGKNTDGSKPSRSHSHSGNTTATELSTVKIV
ncbi:hypothetical protein PWT90_10320 [Aphanocladium album]|nr:hypothetical protein PWT90_10320 [Aphanocladium album]